MTIQQFFDKYNGKFVEYHSYGAGALYQCADLANQFIKEVLNLTPIIGTNAKDFPERANKNEFEYIKNTDDFIPQLGDIMVWDLGNAWGHIAIIKSANINNFVSFDQNWPTGSPCKFVTHNYNGVRGVLRAKTMSTQTDLDACLQAHGDAMRAIKEKDENFDRLTKELKIERENHAKDNGSNSALIEQLRTNLAVQEAKNTKLEAELANADTSKDCDQLLNDKELEIVKSIDENLKSVKELRDKYIQMNTGDEITGSNLIDPEKQSPLLRFLIAILKK